MLSVVERPLEFVGKLVAQVDETLDLLVWWRSKRENQPRSGSLLG
ncbi:MAG: hypothetical protein QNJ54_06800 [Prochloraceae cyanobacterium]|nr:hypothetical protein [Prochloraceae cyanobacterium]